MENTGELFPPDPLVTLAGIVPGSFNDETIVRSLVTEAIRLCGKSREQIADEMTVMVGEKITLRMLNSYTSAAAEQHRFPQQYARAFCAATGDSRLLRCIAERAGLHIISGDDLKLLALGRQILTQKRAARQIALLETELEGVTL